MVDQLLTTLICVYKIRLQSSAEQENKGLLKSCCPQVTLTHQRVGQLVRRLSKERKRAGRVPGGAFAATHPVSAVPVPVSMLVCHVCPGLLPSATLSLPHSHSLTLSPECPTVRGVPDAIIPEHSQPALEGEG